MKTIYKYGIHHLREEQDIRVTKGFNPLHVGAQHNVICIWGEVDDDEDEFEHRSIFIVGTGNPLPNEPVRYLGTVQTMGGELIWHIYIDAPAQPRVTRL